MLRRLVPALVAILGATAASGAVVGAAAAAAQGMTISLGAPTLSSRVLITEPVTVSCPPFDPSLTYFQGDVTVTAEQASGREIVSGSGSLAASLIGSSNPLPFACDGSQQTLSIPVLANAMGSPFHGGSVVLSASVSAGAGIPCFPGSITTCFEGFTTQSATAGPTPLRLH
jgi:hypothetical protein